ncbi:MAG TPA: hypothetical protein VE978_05260 [Chitinophagales bacterium]|nr:hypothetical protein [Chitinophagales bacterium]
MKKSLLTLLCFVCACSAIYAQWGLGKVSELQEAKNRTLIVMLESESPGMLKKLEKEGNADLRPRYKQVLDEYNENIQQVAKSCWTFNDKIEFKTADEIDKLRSEKNKSYVVLLCYTMKNAAVTTMQNFGLDYSITDLLKPDDKKSGLGEIVIMKINLIEDINKEIPLYYVGLPNIFPKKADLQWGMETIHWYFNARLANAKAKDIREMYQINSSKLAGMTLLIREKDLDEELKPAAIKKIYPYPYKVVNQETFDSIILNHSDGYAYVINSASMEQGGGSVVRLNQYITHAKDGIPYALVKPSGSSNFGAGMLSSYGISSSAGSNTIDERIFTEIVRQIKGEK